MKKIIVISLIIIGCASIPMVNAANADTTSQYGIEKAEKTLTPNQMIFALNKLSLTSASKDSAAGGEFRHDIDERIYSLDDAGIMEYAQSCVKMYNATGTPETKIAYVKYFQNVYNCLIVFGVQTPENDFRHATSFREILMSYCDGDGVHWPAMPPRRG